MAAKMDSLKPTGELQEAVKTLREMQSACAKLATDRDGLQTQLLENDQVQAELKLLEDDANVFKLVGPVLVKQDLAEARANIDRRIEHIKGELGRVDARLKGTDAKLNEQKSKVLSMQQAMQRPSA